MISPSPWYHNVKACFQRPLVTPNSHQKLARLTSAPLRISLRKCAIEGSQKCTALYINDMGRYFVFNKASVLNGMDDVLL